MIPASIMKAAEEAFDNLLCNCVESCGGAAGLRQAAIEDIASAILSERHRCAVIARQWKETPHKSEQYAANTIADRIMAGDAA
jgi:hypothetical protein